MRYYGSKPLKSPAISEKKIQNYEEAIEFLKKEPSYSLLCGIPLDNTVYLQDISKKLYDENLILTALENGKCKKFADIPARFRTKAVCMMALQHLNTQNVLTQMPAAMLTREVYMTALRTANTGVIDVIPDKYFIDYEFALLAVSFYPSSVDKVLSLYREARESEAYSKEDVSIILEAMCPKGCGGVYLNNPRRAHMRDEILAGRSFEQYCTEEYGYISKKHMFFLYKTMKEENV